MDVSGERINPNLALLAVGGLAAYALYRKLSSKGIGELAGGLLGGGSVSHTTAESGGGSLPMPAPPASGNPLDALSGKVVEPPNGGTVQRPLFGSTVPLEVEIVNAGDLGWHGPMRLEVYEDYLLSDAQGGFVEDVTIPARSSRRFSIEYRLTVNVDVLRNPNLWINLFAGTALLEENHEVIVT